MWISLSAWILLEGWETSIFGILNTILQVPSQVVQLQLEPQVIHSDTESQYLCLACSCQCNLEYQVSTEGLQVVMDCSQLLVPLCRVIRFLHHALGTQHTVLSMQHISGIKSVRILSILSDNCPYRLVVLLTIQPLTVLDPSFRRKAVIS